MPHPSTARNADSQEWAYLKVAAILGGALLAVLAVGAGFAIYLLA